jgi:hypothetical protein
MPEDQPIGDIHSAGTCHPHGQYSPVSATCLRAAMVRDSTVEVS